MSSLLVLFLSTTSCIQLDRCCHQCRSLYYFSGICADIVAEVCGDAMGPGASLFLHLALKLLPVPGALDGDACMRCIARARTRWKGMALDVEYGMAWSKEDKGHHFFIQGTNRYS
ncbi:hypothetical protein C8R42DRAFT_233828 [Lentinula raphanica]|nr:hypothetical protein C8R42DRAFT_233828 [Lentinula raphanica]